MDRGSKSTHHVSTQKAYDDFAKRGGQIQKIPEGKRGIEGARWRRIIRGDLTSLQGKAVQS